MKYNQRILQVETSEIRQFNDYAKSVGANIILTLGEPDFNTPSSITNKTIDALLNHKTKYGPTSGIQELREKISWFEHTYNHVDYSKEEILVTEGSTEGLTSALFTMINPEDEVIVFTPSYPMYRQIIQFAGGKVKAVDTTRNHFQISKQMLDEAINEKTKCIILTSPNNPTGTILSDKSLETIYQAVKGTEIFIICDDVYNQIVYTKRKPGFVKYQDLKNQIIVCQSYSKSYAMPGWRCGYLLASKEFLEQASKIHQYMIVALNTFIQDGMIEALNYDNTSMIESYKERRDYIYHRLKDMEFDVELPEGAFYIFPSIKKFGLSSTEFCKRFAKEYHVAIIPGHCFEADDYIRFSYCVSKETITEAMDCLEKFIKDIKSN